MSHPAEVMRRRRQRMIRTGWAYHTLRWVMAGEGSVLDEERARLVDELFAAGALATASGSKIQLGALSPGCQSCAAGGWSCAFVGARCTATCHFCPQGLKTTAGHEDPLEASGWFFSDPDGYVDYLEHFGFEGVGLSGGEPLLFLEDRVLPVVARIRERLGSGIYLWIYTNGDLATPDRLRRLARAGIDEIRFNIAAREYDLERVAETVGIVDTVTIEIPAIPEDEDRVAQMLPKIEAAGVQHLNLHQLGVTGYSFTNFIGREIALLHSGDFENEIPCARSELSALRIMREATRAGLALPIQYCAQVFKFRHHRRGDRTRLARAACQPFEALTAGGYVRRVSLRGDHTDLLKHTAKLAQAGHDQHLWDLSDDRLRFHSSLLSTITSPDNAHQVRIAYDDLYSTQPPDPCWPRADVFELRVGGTRVLHGQRVEVVELDGFTPDTVVALVRYLDVDGAARSSSDGDNAWQQIVARLSHWEQVPIGLQPIF